MQITEETATVLKLEASQLSLGMKRLGGIGSGAIFVLAGLAVIIFFGELTILTCNRIEASQVSCELSSSGLLGKKIIPIAVGQLTSSKVQVSRSSDNGSNTYRVALITKSNQIPLTNSYSSGRGEKQRKVNQINGFIDDPEQLSLDIRQDERWFAYAFGGVFALVGGSLIYGSLKQKLQTSCLFDKGSGNVYLSQRDISSSEVKEWLLNQVKEAQIITRTTRKGKTQAETQLILKSGEIIPLQISGTSANHRQVADSINEFLGTNSLHDNLKKKI